MSVDTTGTRIALATTSRSTVRNMPPDHSQLATPRPRPAFVTSTEKQ